MTSTEETISRLFEIIEICDTHLKRVHYAKNQLDDLFPQTLKSLGEDCSEKSFIDVLNRLEKLQLIPDHQQWIMMRGVRNQLSHQYPSKPDESVEGMNSLYKNISDIDAIYTDLRSHLKRRFQG